MMKCTLLNPDGSGKFYILFSGCSLSDVFGALTKSNIKIKGYRKDNDSFIVEIGGETYASILRQRNK